MDSTPKIKEDNLYEFKPFVVPKYRIKFERANKLSDIPGYVWYTPAAMYLWGRFTDINLSDIVKDADIKIFWYKFDQPIFRNFEAGADKDWNHTLWAAREDQWKYLVDRVLESIQFDIAKEIVYQYALQTITIYDPLNLDRNKLIKRDSPKIEVSAFAVLSNIGQCAFSPNPGNPPGMSTFKPLPVHTRTAKRLFSLSNLNQDKAFQFMKAILSEEQEAEYQRKVEKENKDGRK